MASAIDETKPVAGNPQTAAERGNWAAAKGEISALQIATQGFPFLPLSGAAMRGPMTLFNDPTGPMSPVTLGYFQANGGGGGGGGGIPDAPADGVPYGRQDSSWQHVLGLAGGTMTAGIHFATTAAGNIDLSQHLDLSGGLYGLNVVGTSLGYVAPAAGSHTFRIGGIATLLIAATQITAAVPVVLPADPLAPLQASTKQYTDAQVATKLADAPNDGFGYLRRNQAWQQGTVVLGPSATGAAGPSFIDYSTTQSRFASLTGSLTPFGPNSDGLIVAARRTATPQGANGIQIDGPYINLTGPSYPSPNVVTINTGNNAAGYKAWIFDAAGGLTTPGAVSIHGPAADPLNVFAPNGQPSRTLYTVTGTRTWSCGATGDGRFAIADESGASVLLQLSYGGLGPIRAPQGRLISGGGVPSGNPSLSMYDTAIGSMGLFLGSAANLYFSSMDGNGGFSNILAWFDINSNFTVNGHGFQPGGGPWNATSDSRIKRVEGVYTKGLADLVRLQPKQFVYLGNDTPTEPIAPEGKAIALPYANSPHREAAEQGRLFTGLVAQDVQTMFPECVTETDGFIDGQAVTDLRHVDTGPLLYAVLNALKEISNRLDALEGK